MRKLSYRLDVPYLRKIKVEIVPTLFTAHQFSLIEKKFLGKKMTASERNEFSRTISRKINAINALMNKESIFIYGKEKILPNRLEKAKEYLHSFSRKFKNKPVLITGSFLYNQKYNDIDVFVMSKYEKNDYHHGQFHINYLAEESYHSLFFNSLRKVCVSNREITPGIIMEKITIDTLISLYQEVFNDLHRKFAGVKRTLREFLLQAAYLSKSPLPASDELHQQVKAILMVKKPQQLIKRIFIHTIMIGTAPPKARREMKEMISSYQDIAKEYPQHKDYYNDLIDSFQEVRALES